MKMSYSFSLILLSLLTLAVHYGILYLIRLEWDPIYYLLYLYFPLLSLLIHSFLKVRAEGRPQTFVTYFMGSMAVKLFLSLMILLVVLYLRPDIKVPFAIAFLFMYLEYTTLNTAFLFNKLRDQQS